MSKGSRIVPVRVEDELYADLVGELAIADRNRSGDERVNP